MQNIKKWILSVCLCLLILLIPFSVFAEGEAPKDNEKVLTVSKQNHVIHMARSNDTASFWEYPVLTAGQNRQDGVLTIENKVNGRAVVHLTSVDLPYDNQEALDYLNALRLFVKDEEGNVVYDDSYAHIADLDENGSFNLLSVELEKGQKKTYHVEMSCDFAYEGVANCGQVLVFTYSVDIKTPHWLIYAIAGLVTVLVLAAVVVFLVVSYKKKNAFGAMNDAWGAPKNFS